MTLVETQKKLVIFNDKLKDCTGCTQKFTDPESFDSWYPSFQAYSIQENAKNGTECKDSWNDTDKTVAPAKFMPCLNKFLDGPGGRYAGSIK